MSTKDAALVRLLCAVAAGDAEAARRLLAAAPALARQALVEGATRSSPEKHFVAGIGRAPYEGDTALHVAAMAYAAKMARLLLAAGADVRAQNRRGTEPLHGAVTGIPGSPHWNPKAQRATIECLLDAGADPDAANKDGATPLHQAVRNRCAAAVEVLLARGAQPLRQNKSGSTPLHLAVQTTGRGGTGLPEARAEQEAIIRLLLRHGARAADRDAKGKTVEESITSDWIRPLLRATR